MGFRNWYLSLRGEETLVRQLSACQERNETGGECAQCWAGAWCRRGWVPDITQSAGTGPRAISDEAIREPDMRPLSDIKIGWSRDNLDRHPPTLRRVISNLDININSLMTLNSVQNRPRGQVPQYPTFPHKRVKRSHYPAISHTIRQSLRPSPDSDHLHHN